MAAKSTRRVKKRGKSIGFKMVTIGLVFLGLLAVFRRVAVEMGLGASAPAAIAMAGFVAGIATQRYIF